MRRTGVLPLGAQRLSRRPKVGWSAGQETFDCFLEFFGIASTSETMVLWEQFDVPVTAAPQSACEAQYIGWHSDRVGCAVADATQAWDQQGDGE